MDSQMNFVITEDKATADAFKKAGFQIVQTVGNAWLFLNDKKKMMFTNTNKDTNLVFTYTNKMMF